MKGDGPASALLAETGAGVIRKEESQKPEEPGGLGPIGPFSTEGAVLPDPEVESAKKDAFEWVGHLLTAGAL